jgi:hypothetical protein
MHSHEQPRTHTRLTARVHVVAAPRGGVGVWRWCMCMCGVYEALGE